MGWPSVQAVLGRYEDPMTQTTIRISDRAWLALKQVQVEYKNGKAPECRTFWELLEAIGLGDDDLLGLWREKMAALKEGE
jgi:hypothetical protein